MIALSIDNQIEKEIQCSQILIIVEKCFLR